MVVYIDVLFLTNLILNYFLLLASARLTNAMFTRWRLVCAGIFGAAYSCVVFFADLHTFTLPLNIILAVLLCLVSFGKRNLLKNSALFIFTSFIFAGAVFALTLLGANIFEINNGVLYFDMPFWFLILSTIIIYGVITIFFNNRFKKAETKYLTCSARLNENSVSFKAMYDTGCNLTDPSTNKSVMILEPILFDKLMKESEKFWFTPCKTIMGTDLLLCIKPDNITINNKSFPNGVIARSNSRLSNDFEAIIGEQFGI